MDHGIAALSVSMALKNRILVGQAAFGLSQALCVTDRQVLDCPGRCDAPDCQFAFKNDPLYAPKSVPPKTMQVSVLKIYDLGGEGSG